MKSYYWGTGNTAREGAAKVAAEQEIAEYEIAEACRERNAALHLECEAVIRLDDLLAAEMDVFASSIGPTERKVRWVAP